MDAPLGIRDLHYMCVDGQDIKLFIGEGLPREELNALHITMDAALYRVGFRINQTRLFVKPGLNPEHHLLVKSQFRPCMYDYIGKTPDLAALTTQLNPACTSTASASAIVMSRSTTVTVKLQPGMQCDPDLLNAMTREGFHIRGNEVDIRGCHARTPESIWAVASRIARAHGAYIIDDIDIQRFS